jgi:hypothetical protein
MNRGTRPSTNLKTRFTRMYAPAASAPLAPEQKLKSRATRMHAPGKSVQTLHSCRQDDNLKSRTTRIHACTVSTSSVPGHPPEHCWAADRRVYPTSTTRTAVSTARALAEQHGLTSAPTWNPAPLGCMPLLSLHPWYLDHSPNTAGRPIKGSPNISHSHCSQYRPGTGGVTRLRK